MATPIYVEDGQIIQANGGRARAVRLDDIAYIRIQPTGQSRLRVSFEALDGRRVVVKLSAMDPDTILALSLINDLIVEISRKNPFVLYFEGYSLAIWRAAWLAFLVSVGLGFLLARAALTGRGIPTAVLPLSIFPLGLCMILPAIENGRGCSVSLQTLLKRLAAFRTEANLESNRAMRRPMH